MPVGSTSNAGKTGRGPIIEVKNLRKEYPVLDETVVALERVNLAIPQGQICCIYGESGSGKSTLLNQLAGMEKPTKGGVRIAGVPISRLDERQLAEFRQKHLGFVFQSYNLLPNLNAIENVAMPLMFRGVSKRKREMIARAMLKRVGLGKRMNHYPAQMSGGQQQRVGIARALIMNPKLIIADECISALDVSIQAQVVNLMKDIQQETGTAYLFIAHDLSMVKYISDRIGVLHLGHLLETGTTEEIFADPIHPYTRSLLSAIPLPNPVVEKRRVAETYDYATSGIDYSKGTSHLVSGSHYVKCTDEEFAKWCK